MSYLALLPQTCTIQRASVPQLDGYRQAAKTWVAETVGVRCRLVERGQRITNDDRTQLLAVKTLTLLLPAGTTIDESRRVVDVAANGTTIDAGPFEVTAVLRRRSLGEHHVSVALKRVQ